jgi:hypothetical protein
MRESATGCRVGTFGLTLLRFHLFPFHRQPGSQVPYESLDESRVAFAPDTAWPVSRYPPCFSQDDHAPRFWCHLVYFDASAIRLHSPLSSPHHVIKCHAFYHNVHHHGHWTAAAYGSLKPPLQGPRGPPSSLAQHDAIRVFLTQVVQTLSADRADESLGVRISSISCEAMRDRTSLP